MKANSIVERLDAIVVVSAVRSQRTARHKLCAQTGAEMRFDGCSCRWLRLGRRSCESEHIGVAKSNAGVATGLMRVSVVRDGFSVSGSVSE